MDKLIKEVTMADNNNLKIGAGVLIFIAGFYIGWICYEIEIQDKIHELYESGGYVVAPVKKGIDIVPVSVE